MATGPQPSAIQLLTDALRELPDTLTSTSALTQLPKFSGKTNEFQDWVLELERHFLVFGCDDAKKKKVVFQTSSGSVCEFLKRFLAGNQQITYEELKDELKLRYGEITDSHHALKLLRSVKQRQGENVATYGERILSLAKDACSGMPAPGDNIQRMLVGQFTDGLLSDQVRIKLIRNNPANLTEAVNLALREQNILKRVTLRKGAAYDWGREPSGREEPPADRYEPMQVDHARMSRKCHKCGRKGHFAKECRAVRAVNERNTTPTRTNFGQNYSGPTREPNRQTREQMRCWACGLTGHLRRDCRQAHRLN